MTDGLLLSELPLTIADAVLVTRSLGVKYLWVDALCIIQDSVEDWERESEQMSTIYENASPVIAASTSSAATQGFLSHQRQRLQHHFTTPESYGIPGTIAIRERPWSGLHNVFSRTDPLGQRAWAFQEQYMSTRCLLFSADEMQWVCKQEVACECGQNIITSINSSLLFHCNNKPQSDMANTELTLQARQSWRMAVAGYSSRKLTRADDKLPAISGIASWFAARWELRYVAGLWKENIIQDLLWERRRAHPAPLPPDYVAPSFSWASINHMVCYPFDELDHLQKWDWVPCSTICDVESVVLGRNPFGKVSDAWITLQAPLIRGSLKPSTTKDAEFRSDDGSVSMELNLDSYVAAFSYAAEDNELETSVQRYKLPLRSEQHERERPNESGEPHFSLQFGQASEGTKSSLWQATVWLLRLARKTLVQVAAEDVLFCDFYLALGKSPRDPRKYERIGSWNDYEVTEKKSKSFRMQKITIL